MKALYQVTIKRLWEKLTRDERLKFTRSLVKKVHAADIADIIANLSDDERRVETFSSIVDDERKSDIFSELPEEIQRKLFHEIDIKLRVALFKELSPDDAVDFLGLLEEEEQNLLLNTLPLLQQEKLRCLLRYGRESAGGIMTPILMSAKENQTTGEIIDLLRKQKEEIDEVLLNIFVIDDAGILIGTLPLQTLVVSDPNEKVSDVMDSYPITVSVQHDQELVAQIVSKYNLIAVPVVDQSGKLVGRITLDDIFDVLQEEADEDVCLMAGVGTSEARVQSAFSVARLRLPWLLTCLAGSMVSGIVINSYHDTLSKVIVLVSFLPAICAMGGNSGLQTSTVTMRNLAHGQVFYNNIKKIVKRELLSGSIIGIVAGTVMGIIAYFWLKQPLYGGIIGISMIMTILISTCNGFFIPIFFNKVGIDPAVASGPLITTLNDATSSFTYLTIATILLKCFGLL